MKKEELMHGDLLMYYGHLCRFVIRPNGAIIERLDDKSEYLPCSCESDKAEPILITDDILKANGFSREGCFWSFAKKRFEYIFLRLFDDEDRNEMSKEACEFFDGYWIVDSHYRIKYVHELQHILRIVGLLELGDNFVIEKGDNNDN